MAELRILLKEKLDLASHDLLLQATDLMDSETLNLQQVVGNYDITLCVWGNLSKNPRWEKNTFMYQASLNEGLYVGNNVKLWQSG